MSDFTLTDVSRFPEGTSVEAYAASDWPAHTIEPTGAPPGVAADTETMTGGTLTFSGLTQDATYYAYAEVGGQHRYVRFVSGADISEGAPGGEPTGTAGGDLTGTYPSPTIGANKVTAAKASTGTGATNLTVGNDARLSDARTPTNASVTAAKFGSTPSARVYNSAATTLTTAISAILNFDTERFDTDSMHSTALDTSRLTATTAGLYLITANLSFAGNVTGDRTVSLKLNGSTYIAVTKARATSSAATNVQSVAIYKLAATEYVEVEALQNSGGNLDVLAIGNYSPEFGMAFIGTGA